jgi:hypothetical protein
MTLGSTARRPTGGPIAPLPGVHRCGFRVDTGLARRMIGVALLAI